jgi:hypothetical protein
MDLLRASGWLKRLDIYEKFVSINLAFNINYIPVPFGEAVRVVVDPLGQL